MIYTCTHAFQNSCTARSNFDNFYVQGFLTILIVGGQGTSTLLLLAWHLCRCIIIRIVRQCLRGCKYFDFIHSSIYVIFYLHSLQKVTQIFVGNGSIILLFLFQFILNVCCKTVLICNTNLILIELFVTVGPI